MLKIDFQRLLNVF